MKYNSTYHPQFITATILEWKQLLKDDAFKSIIISSLQFLHKEGSIVIYAFVIMPNHIHMIWQIQEAKDRTYQIWERNSLSIDLWSEKVFIQKLNYIHNNPCKHPGYLVKYPENTNIHLPNFILQALMILVF